MELLRGRRVALWYLSDLPGASAGFHSGRLYMIRPCTPLPRRRLNRRVREASIRAGATVDRFHCWLNVPN